MYWIRGWIFLDYFLLGIMRYDTKTILDAHSALLFTICSRFIPIGLITWDLVGGSPEMFNSRLLDGYDFQEGENANIRVSPKRNHISAAKHSFVIGEALSYCTSNAPYAFSLYIIVHSHQSNLFRCSIMNRLW